MFPIKIKRLDKTLPLPTYHSAGAAAFDFYSRLDLTVQPGELVRVPTNFVIATPPGHTLVVCLRSSTPKRKGLSHPAGIGVVDPDYCGPNDEIMVQVYNHTAAPVSIERGERIGQGFIVAVPRLTFEEVDEMDAPTRGGFGTTGT